jgi:putative ABC transport system substrate-binding protein
VLNGFSLHGFAISLGVMAGFSLSSPAARGEARVVVLKSSGISLYSQALAGFRKGFRGSINEHNLGGDENKGRRILEAMKDAPPDVIVAIGAKAAIAARQALPDVPMVYSLVVNPKRIGIQGPNVAGVAHVIPAGEQFTFLKKIAPQVRRIGVVHHRSSSATVREGHKGALAHGLTLVTREVKKRDDVPQALSAILAKVDAVWLIADLVVVTQESFEYLLTKSFEAKLPILAYSKAFVKGGALVALSPDYVGIGGAVAELANEIISQGIVTPREVSPPGELFINSVTATRLGLALPSDLRARAHILP